MFLTPYFEKTDDLVSVTQAQASQFAKSIAQDFNPIHDIGAKRFCVPGDLLFALVLSQYGLRQKMNFRFSGMVGEGVLLKFPHEIQDEFILQDNHGKSYLSSHRSGDTSHNEAQIESFIRNYVAFSGLNFPHIMVPLMKQHQVMVNPSRPLVIYESMSFELSTLDFTQIELSLVKQQLQLEGKRGNVILNFEFHRDRALVGTGIKRLVLSGLRPYETQPLQMLCDNYEASRVRFST